MLEETAVAVREPEATLLPHAPELSDDDINRMFRIANALAASNMFKSVTQAEQAFAKLLIGRDLGLTPAQSMQSIYVFDGNVSVHYSMILHFIRSRPGYSYRIMDHTKEACSFVVLIDDQEVAPPETFTIQDAADAGLLGKDNWKKYPKNMLLARVVANYVRWHVPEVCAGLPVYVPDEVDETARVVDGSVEPTKLGAPAVAENDAIWGYVNGRIGPDRTERFKAVIARAGWNPAEVQMKLDGQSRTRLVAILEQLEAEHPADAEVIEEPEAEPDPDDKLDEREDAADPPEKLDDREAAAPADLTAKAEEARAAVDEQVVSLLARIDQIHAMLETDVSPEAAADLEQELDYTLDKVRELTADPAVEDAGEQQESDEPPTLL